MEKSDKIKINLVSGFKNLGNTCYISSILQSLVHTLPILKLVLKQEYNSFDINSTKEAFITMNFFHILYQYTKEKCVIYPKTLISNIITYSKLFHKFRQEDANEFLMCLLDIFHKSLSENIKITVSSNNISENQESKYLEYWGYSVIYKIFYGNNSVKKECDNCGKFSEEMVFYNQIIIPKEKTNTDTVYSFITNMYCKEIKTEKCIFCNNITKKQIYNIPKKIPDTLIVLLNTTKKETNLREIDEVLKLKDTVYLLYSVVCHSGSSLNSGHYTNFSRVNNEWYHFNDDTVTKADTFNKDDSFILFYQRI